MSFIRQNHVSPPAVKSARVNTDRPNFFLEMAPKMIATHEFDMNKWNAQMDTIAEMQNKYTDLNRLYPLELHDSHGNRSYSQTQAFTRLCSAEHMIQIMERYGLTMRLNIKRPSEHSSSHTCMELGREHLSHLISEKADDSGIKTIQLRAKSDAKSDLPKNGEMYVTLRETNGGHLFQHVEYEISEHHDNALHSKINF